LRVSFPDSLEDAVYEYIRIFVLLNHTYDDFWQGQLRLVA